MVFKMELTASFLMLGMFHPDFFCQIFVATAMQICHTFFYEIRSF